MMMVEGKEGHPGSRQEEIRIERERQTMGNHSASMQEARDVLDMGPGGDQLTRDQLLRQRLWAASNDSDAVTEMLADLTKTPPHAGEQQEEGMRSIESSLSLIAWHCKRLKDFVGKGDKT